MLYNLTASTNSWPRACFIRWTFTDFFTVCSKHHLWHSQNWPCVQSPAYFALKICSVVITRKLFWFSPTQYLTQRWGWLGRLSDLFPNNYMLYLGCTCVAVAGFVTAIKFCFFVIVAHSQTCLLMTDSPEGERGWTSSSIFPLGIRNLPKLHTKC